MDSHGISVNYSFRISVQRQFSNCALRCENLIGYVILHVIVICTTIKTHALWTAWALGQDKQQQQGCG